MENEGFYRSLLENISHLYPFKSCNNFKCVCFQTHCKDKEFFPAFDIEQQKHTTYMDEEHQDVYSVEYIINVAQYCGEIGERSKEDMMALWKFLTFAPNIVEDLFGELDKKDEEIDKLNKTIDVLLERRVK